MCYRSDKFVDDVYEKSSPLIVDLSKTAENKAFIEHENEELVSEVRSRKLTEKGCSYEVENLVKSKKVSEDHACRNTKEIIVASGMLLWNKHRKQEFSKAQVLWNEIGDRYSEIIEIAQDHEMRNVGAIWEQIDVNGMTLKRMRGKKLNTWSKQCWILVLSVLL